MSRKRAAWHGNRGPDPGRGSAGWARGAGVVLLVLLAAGAAARPVPPAVQAAGLAPAGSDPYAALAGTYTAAGERTIGVYDVASATPGLFQSPLVAIDLDSGRVGALSPLAAGAFAVGPALALTAPVQASVTFARDATGQATSLTWTQPGALPLLARRQPFAEAEVRYPSGDITLAGHLTLPAGGGRHPAVVLVPGSGPFRRGSFTAQWMSILLARHGIATLVSDKRGIGDSGGRYPGDGVASAQLLATLAGDARASMQYLRTRPEIDPARIGLLGYSQGGWIAPLAASQDPGVAFLILIGGPPVSVGTTDLYAEMVAQGASASEIAATMHNNPPTGYDPRPTLNGLHIPALWLYGGRDPLVPPQASQEVLAQLQQAGHPEISTLLFPTGDHQLFDSATGAERDTGRAPGYAPGLLPALSAWLTAHAAPPGPAFAETGHAIGGLFAPYWAAHGGLAAFGVPLGDVMTQTSVLNGRVYAVQTFQQAVLEYHPAYAGSPFAVLPAQLGTLRYQARYGPAGAPGQTAARGPGAVHFFPETGHRVGGAFWAYWQQHGGLAQLGYPVSDEFAEPAAAASTLTHTVQYFERAVLEAHPENPPPYDVLRLPLGTQVLQATAPPGSTLEGRFDVGGYRLWLRCTGAGRPTVVLDAGLGTPGSSWNGVVPEIAAVTRVCTYDRANVGQSDPGPRPRSAAQIVAELHTLLAAAGVPAPYVLVGHSQGGLNMQLYARTYPAQVEGLVLVDAVPPRANARDTAALTPAQAAERDAILVANAEQVTLADLQASDAEVLAAGPLPAIPLIVLRHGQPLAYPAGWPVATLESIWSELQADLARQSPLGRLVVAPQSGHFIQRDQPGLVSDAVRTVVAMTWAR